MALILLAFSLYTPFVFVNFRSEILHVSFVSKCFYQVFSLLRFSSSARNVELYFANFNIALALKFTLSLLLISRSRVFIS